MNRLVLARLSMTLQTYLLASPESIRSDDAFILSRKLQFQAKPIRVLHIILSDVVCFPSVHVADGTVVGTVHCDDGDERSQ